MGGASPGGDRALAWPSVRFTGRTAAVYVAPRSNTHILVTMADSGWPN